MDPGTRAAMADTGTPWAMVGSLPPKMFLGRLLPGGRSESTDTRGRSGVDSVSFWTGAGSGVDSVSS